MGISLADRRISLRDRIKHFLEKKESVKEAVVKSSGINFLARFVGYLKYLAVAVFIGFSQKTDAFFVAASFLGMFMIFVDVFDSVGIPNLVKAKQRSEKEFQDIAANLFAITLILAAVVTVASLLASPFIAKIAFGFSVHRQKYVQLYFLLLVPELFSAFLFHHFGAILRSERKFTIFFVGQLVFSIVCTLTLFITLPIFHAVWMIPAALSLAQIIAAVFIAIYARKFFKIKLELNDQVKNISRQIFFLSLLYGIGPLYTLADTLFASYLSTKTISALNYGISIATLPATVLQFSTIAITSLSESEADWNKVKRYLRVLILFSLPFIIGCWLLITPILKLFLTYGRFTILDLDLTSEAVRYYILSLPFFLCWPVLYRAYQVRNKLLPLIIFAVIGALFNFFLKFYFIFHLKLAIRGITFTTFISYCFICVVSYLYYYYYLNKKQSQNIKDSSG
jgi:putative peptidoglycan lipid II flippase